MRMKTNNIAAWLTNAAGQLSSLTSAPNLEAQLLLAEVLQKSRTWCLAHPDVCLSQKTIQVADSYLQRALEGEPLPYILHRQEFFGLPFEVTPAVLIPRPETEMLVEHALTWLNSHPGIRIVTDIGTGSGCIAITLALKAPSIKILASDISFAALQVAQSNAQFHHVRDHIHFIQSDLLTGISTKLDLICANLPYIPGQTLNNLPVARHEPRIALDGGPDGLRIIETLLRQARLQVNPGGCLLLEIEYTQEESGFVLARSIFPEAEIQVERDLAGHPRLLSVQTMDQHV